MRINPITHILCLLLLTLGLSAHAQQWRVDPITPLDQQFMDKAKDQLNDNARRSLGRSFGQSRDSDLQLMQTMLDRHLVDDDNLTQLQAMGIIMGEYLQREHSLRWVVYSDNKGRSRALEVPTKDEFIFPVTQISSRVSVGAEVDVKAIYEKLESEIARIKKMIIIR